MKDGNLGGETPIGLAHLSTSSEFMALFTTDFIQLEFVGTECFTNGQQHHFLKLSLEEQEAFLDLVEITGKTPDGQGASDHFLYIGEKK